MFISMYVFASMYGYPHPTDFLQQVEKNFLYNGFKKKKKKKKKFFFL